MEEKNMEDQKNILDEQTDFSIDQDKTTSVLDTESTNSINISSLSTENPQLSSLDTNSSLNLKSDISFSMFKTQPSSNTSDESVNLTESNFTLQTEESLQPEVASPDIQTDNVLQSNPENKQTEIFSLCDSDTDKPSPKNIKVSNSSSSLEKPLDSKDKEAFNESQTKDRFINDSNDVIIVPDTSSSSSNSPLSQGVKTDSKDCIPETDFSAIFQESLSDNVNTKRTSVNTLSISSNEIFEPSADPCHNFDPSPSKKLKPDLKVDTESSKPTESTLESSDNVIKPSSMESDSSLGDAQPENITEVVAIEDEQLEMNEVEQEYPSYNFSQAPKFLTQCSEEFQSGNFLKGCKWAPDGSCILTNSDDRCLRLFNLPEQIYNSEISNVSPLESVLRMQESATIYDYCWYPGMSSAMPETCCLVSTSKDTPVHMWDAFTGELRCSYRAYDQVDEITAAHSLSFSLDGQKLYCGFNKMIRVFDVDKPGRDFSSRPTYHKNDGGQAGIISCIIPSPVDYNLYAVGSYSKEVGLYSEPSGSMVCMFQGHQGGVTHIRFSPDGNRIYSGGRKDPEILCWDLRNPGTILFIMLRKSETNQRIYFDLDRSGRYMMSGNHDGAITVWDTTSTPVTMSNNTDPLLYPCLTYPAHNDTVNGISIHPSLPIVASASGQRHFSIFDDDSGSEDDSVEKQTVRNDLRLWWFT